MSTVLWALWAAAVGALAAGAAYVVEPVARALRWPTRALWAVALPAQVAVVAWPLAGAGMARPHGAFVGAWMVATVAAACLYLRAWRLLRRERAAWRVTVAEEMPVWVSERTGPAVVGFLRSIVVAPAWAMAMRERERRLLLRHEAEHVAAWDPTLLLAGLVACALVPWSPAAWWALARLRLAMEVDCDRRVLRAEPDVAAYGELLVEMSARVEPGAATLAAFAERRLPIEERIEAMTARVPRGAAWRWTGRGLVAATLVLGACAMPYPRTMVVVVQQPATVAAPTAAARGRAEADDDDGATGAEIERAMLRRVIRDYLLRPDVRPITPYSKIFLAIDGDGNVIGDTREPWVADANGGWSFSYHSDSMSHRFPGLRMREFHHGGALDIRSIFPDTVAQAAVIYAFRPRAGDPQRVATQRAITRLFGASGPPRDTAVGIVIAFGPSWDVREVRRVPLLSVPTALNVRPSVRAQLLPSLRGQPIANESATTGSGDWGLAEGSRVHTWRIDERVRGIDMTLVEEGVATALERHFASEPRPTGTLTAWVLLAPDGTSRQVRVEQRATTTVNLDSVHVHLPASRDRQLEGFGFLGTSGFDPLGPSRVVWALEMRPEDIRSRGLPARP